MFPRTEKLSTKAIWKVSIGGENLLSPCFGIPGPEIPVEKHLKGLLRNPGKEAITVNYSLALQRVDYCMGVGLLTWGASVCSVRKSRIFVLIYRSP